MAGCMSLYDSDDSDDAADLSGWTNGKDSGSQQARCDIIRNIRINQQGLGELRSILGSGWDVNELLNLYDHDLYNVRYGPLDLLSYVIGKSSDNIYLSEIVRLLLENGANPNLTHMVEIEMTRETKWVHWTALHEAANQGWSEGVKMLLDAGAKCTTSDVLQNPLTVALKGHDCPPDLIKVLLKHNADPNDPDDEIENIPLLTAIRKCRHGKNDTVNLQLLLAHGANPNVTHRVNIGGYGEVKWVQSTALYEAVKLGLTDVVKMLLDAGAKCTVSDASQNPLALALQKKKYQPDITKLLLKYGADPNDHDDQLKSIPLLNAIVNLKYAQNDTEIVQLLLEHGANPNVVHKANIGEHGEWVHRSALHEAVKRQLTAAVEMLLDFGAKCKGFGALENPLMLAIESYQRSPRLVELLLKHGADAEVEKSSLLQGLSQCIFQAHHWFPQLVLYCFFLHGGNINMEDCYHHMALEWAIIIECGHINRVRWLIRHGADTLPNFTLLKGCIMPSRDRPTWFPDKLLILLQAGMRVSHAAQTQLGNMKVAISTWLLLGIGIIDRTIECMWDHLVRTEEKELQMVQHYRKKSSFPEYWTQQMADLKEFSDESLQVYPQDTPTEDTRQQFQKAFGQIHRVLEFLSQPQSLQWYCRRCVRENLVSLQPSVVKTLPGPSRLKRYILCHEI